MRVVEKTGNDGIRRRISIERIERVLEHQCETCGAWFTPHQGNQRYDSKRCKHRAFYQKRKRARDK